MTVLMVVFGAGASFDAITLPSGSRRGLPLTDAIFRDSATFRATAKMLGLSQYLADRLCEEHVKVEDVLQALGEANCRDPDLLRIRWCLRFVMSEEYKSVAGIRETNYKRLLQIISRHVAEPVCLVSFNYDLLLEDALTDLEGPMRFTSFQDYYQSRSQYMLFKPHGSLNWARVILEPRFDIGANRTDAQILEEVIAAFPTTLKVDRPFNLIPHWVSTLDDFGIRNGPHDNALDPAIAIPFRYKEDEEFLFPEEILEPFREEVCKVSKLLLIGWRAGEENFLNFLRDNISGSPSGLVVSGGSEYEKCTISKFRNKDKRLAENIYCANAGFNDFLIDSSRLENFLADGG